MHRRKFPNIERPFRVPLVPLLPLLGILSNLYLLVQSTWELWTLGGFFGGIIDEHEQTGIFPVVLAAGTLAVGFVGFILIKGVKHEETAEMEAGIPDIGFEPIC
jgi:amino acid transporter